MKNKKLVLICIMLFLVVLLFLVNMNNKNDKNGGGSLGTTDDIDISIDTDNGEEQIDWSKYQNKTYELKDSITITEGGEYNLSGKISNGLIRVNTEDDVKLILNNVNVVNNSGPAIYIENASDVVIELYEGSINYLEDGRTYSNFDSEVSGVIYSHDDITFDGSGILEVKSNFEDGIVGKDDLKIKSGTYKINSSDDGIRGKDSVYIINGNFEITSNGDGIKSTNDTDEGKGYILIENGNFNIESNLDGVDAQTKLLIKNGLMDIKTGGGSANASTSDSWGNWWGGSDEKANSAKGLKSADNLVIENGTFNFDTSDDSIHCNNYVGVKNGDFNITSGDDGIHADTEIIIDGGTINISKSYEGLESAKITINNGDIKLVSSDDGINIAGGNDSSAMGRPGENSYSSDTDNLLTINNGTVYVNASGDGIDVNGNAYINGGDIKVDGPTNSGNGALDYDSVFEVNAGILLAGGASGMMQGCSSSSKIYNLMIGFTSSYGNGDVIKIVDDSSNNVISYESSKTYSSLVVASEQLKKGETYTIIINDSEYETFTINDMTTTIGNSYGHNSSGPSDHGGPGGHGGRW